MIDAVHASTVSNSPVFSATHSIGEFGQLERLDRLHRDGEVGGILGALRSRREVQHITDRGTRHVLVEVVGDPALPELVRPVLGVEAHDLLAVAVGGDIEREEVAGLRRAIDVGQRAARLQFGFLRLLLFFVGGRRRVEFDPQPGVTRHGDLRSHLALGFELDEPFLFPTGDLDLRCGDEVDVVFADGLAEVLRDRIAECLFAGRADADSGLEHATRRLAVAEARQLHFPGDRAEGLFDVFVELGLVDLDVQLDFVPLEGFDRRFHRARTLPAPGRVTLKRASTPCDPAE